MTKQLFSWRKFSENFHGWYRLQFICLSVIPKFHEGKEIRKTRNVRLDTRSISRWRKSNGGVSTSRLRYFIRSTSSPTHKQAFTASKVLISPSEIVRVQWVTHGSFDLCRQNNCYVNFQQLTRRLAIRHLSLTASMISCKRANYLTKGSPLPNIIPQEWRSIA